MTTRICQSGEFVSLYQDGVLQSRLDCRVPNRLLLPYLEWIAHLIECQIAVGNVRKVVHIGGGLLSLPRYLASQERLKQEVYELDQVVVAAHPVGLPTPDGIDVIQGDGRLRISRYDPGVLDLIIVDALDLFSDSIHLMSEEFFTECEAALSIQGMLIVNAAFISELHVARIYAGLAKRFELVGAIGPKDVHVTTPHNVVFFATHVLKVAKGFLRGDSGGLPHGAAWFQPGVLASPYAEHLDERAPIAFDRSWCKSRLADLRQLLLICYHDGSYLQELHIAYDQLLRRYFQLSV